MADQEQKPASAAASAAQSKEEKARAIYTSWRNEHINNIPTAGFQAVEEKSEHLIAKIAAAL
jgi:hypothetical protein